MKQSQIELSLAYAELQRVCGALEEENRRLIVREPVKLVLEGGEKLKIALHLDGAVVVQSQIFELEAYTKAGGEITISVGLDTLREVLNISRKPGSR